MYGAVVVGCSDFDGFSNFISKKHKHNNNNFILFLCITKLNRSSCVVVYILLRS